MAADVENVENDLFEEALSDSLTDFVHITLLKIEQKHCLRSLVEKKDVFGILSTGFGKSIIFLIIQAEKFLNADWLKRAVFISNTCHIWERVVFQRFDFPYLEESSISRA